MSRSWPGGPVLAGPLTAGALGGAVTLPALCPADTDTGAVGGARRQRASVFVFFYKEAFRLSWPWEPGPFA